MPTAAEHLAAGNPQAALTQLKSEVRARPADARLRTFLFQLLAVQGQWRPAADQLRVCAELDAATLAMANAYGAALPCEVAREAVFAGQTPPHLFSAPQPWLALLAQALVLDAQGHGAEAARARDDAFEQAPTSRGTLNDSPFEWVADADSRLGPVLEVIINGRYGWLPFTELSELRVEPAADLRDFVWAPVQLRLRRGADTVALVPTRYVGAGQWDDAALRLARRTEWLPLDGGEHHAGLGQRVLVTDTQEIGLLDVRQLRIDAP